MQKNTASAFSRALLPATCSAAMVLSAVLATANAVAETPATEKDCKRLWYRRLVVSKKLLMHRPVFR
jgi:hypothetical protein